MRLKELKQEDVTETNLVPSLDWVVREGVSEERTFKNILEAKGISLEKIGVRGAESIRAEGTFDAKTLE